MMNKLVYFFLLVFFVSSFVSCQEEEDQLLAEPIIGKWELRKVFNPWAGTTNYPAGNGTWYVFTEKRFQHYENGTLSRQGTYYLKQEMSELRKHPYIRLVLESNTRMFERYLPISVEINGDQLTLGLEAYDAPSSTYERMR